MYNVDQFSRWLGIELVSVKQGSCSLKMKVRQEMLNGFGIAHGGITYSLADSALAFASNTYGKMAVSIETSISHIIAVKEKDVILAVAEEKSRSNKIAIYEIKITNQDDKLVALFKGTVYIKEKTWSFAD